MENIFKLPYEVVYYDTDVKKRMTLERLVAVCVLVSEEQSTFVGRDAAYLAPLNLGWVITQYEMDFVRMPILGEKLEFLTQATSWNKYFCYRNFWVKDAKGEVIIEMSATFVLMDLTERKLKSVPENIIAPFGGYKENKIKRSPKLPALNATDFLPYRVRYFDLDSNQHVNNSHYFSWMLDALGADFLNAHEVKKVTIRFDKEVAYGQEVQSYVEILDDGSTLHEIKEGPDLFANAQVWWQDRA